MNKARRLAVGLSCFYPLPPYAYGLIGAIAPPLTRFAFYQATGRYPTLSETLAIAVIAALLLIGVAIAPQLSRPAARHHRPPAVVVAPELAARRRRLVNLLYGDTAAADRLLEATHSRYPGRPATWIYDRVIQDLLSDRNR